MHLPTLSSAVVLGAAVPLAMCTSASLKKAQSLTNITGFSTAAYKNGDQSDPKTFSDFQMEMNRAQNLPNAPGVWNSLRLYTNIQSGTTKDPSAAFAAALDTNTTLLLGMWCTPPTSAFKSNLTNELDALETYVNGLSSGNKTRFADLVLGISVCSEDLYRTSSLAAQKDSTAGGGVGVNLLVDLIADTRDALAKKISPLQDIPVGHVDTWNAFTNTTNAKLLEHLDFLGLDEYPYYQSEEENSIDNARELFNDAMSKVNSTLKSNKLTDIPLWITETGWAKSIQDGGDKSGKAVANTANAKKYWDDVGCSELFGRRPVWWYIMENSDSNIKEDFAVLVTSGDSVKTAWNLSCPATSGSPASTNQNSSNTVGGPSGSTGSSSDGGSSGAGRIISEAWVFVLVGLLGIFTL